MIPYELIANPGPFQIPIKAFKNPMLYAMPDPVITFAVNKQRYQISRRGTGLFSDYGVIVDDLLRLMRRFNGDIQSMCESMQRKFAHLDSMPSRLPCLEWPDDEPGFLQFLDRITPEYQIQTSFHLRWDAHGYSNPWVHIPMKQWVIDFDQARFDMSLYPSPRTIMWTMKQLYRIGDAEQWLRSATAWEDNQRRRRDPRWTWAITQPFYGKKLAMAIIRHWLSAIIARRKAFQPPDGVFFLLASRSFAQRVKQQQAPLP